MPLPESPPAVGPVPGPAPAALRRTRRTCRSRSGSGRRPERASAASLGRGRGHSFQSSRQRCHDCRPCGRGSPQAVARLPAAPVPPALAPGAVGRGRPPDRPTGPGPGSAPGLSGPCSRARRQSVRAAAASAAARGQVLNRSCPRHAVEHCTCCRRRHRPRRLSWPSPSPAAAGPPPRARCPARSSGSRRFR